VSEPDARRGGPEEAGKKKLSGRKNARDGRAAMTEYKTEALAIREKAARLK